jgi:hypothetical protein
MYTLAFRRPGNYFTTPHDQIGYAYKFAAGVPTDKYDVITFPDKKEAWIFILNTNRQPVMNPENIDLKNSHFNFSKWDSDNLEIDNHMLNAMKGLFPGDF